MFQTILPEERQKLLPLFAERGYLQLLSEAYLKEKVGDAYTDDIESPSVALLIHKGVVFIAGDEKHSAVPLLLEKVPPKFLILVPSEEWGLKLKSHWGEKVKPYPRTKFSSEGLEIEHLKEIQKNIPEGMVLERLSEDSIQLISQQARNIIVWLFPSLDVFLEKNFGFCLREGDIIVSVALAATPLYNNEFEIHIETDPNYQKRGLAMISCAKLIQYSLENGMTPHWDADNEPSAKLATKLGFTNPEMYNAYFWKDEST